MDANHHSARSSPLLRPSSRQPSLAHEEWMIDESVDQSFPASDPPTSSQPGSIVWQRYAARDAARRSRPGIGWPALALVGVGIALAALWMSSRSRRGSRY